MEDVAILIPTLNEARSIGQVIDRIPVRNLRAHGYTTSVYVIDGLSTDNTLDVAAEKGAHVITEMRKGKGAALKAALRSVAAHYYVIVDGDNTYPLEVVPQMLFLLQTYDVVIGSRLKGVIEPGAMTRLNVIGNKALSVLARTLFSVNMSDVCTGLWAYRGEAIQRLSFEADGFDVEANMCAECARNALQIAEIPITYSARVDDAKLASIRDGVRIGAYMVRKWYAHRTDWTIRREEEPAEHASTI